jgi:RHS repeat-associated protein
VDLPTPPKVDEPAQHPNGSGKQPGASTDDINALQAQLPLGLGSKGAEYVPPAVASPEATALAQAKATGKPVEVLPDRDETTSVAAQPDGTFTAKLTSQIQNVQRSGSWVPVDTSLNAASDGLHPGAIKGTLTLSDGGSASPAAVFSDGAGHTVTLPATSDLPTPTIAGNTATYANVLPNVDLTQSALTSGVEQSLVIKSRPTSALATWKLPIQLTGLTAVADKTGVIDLVDGSGKTVLVSGAPTATDAAGNFTALQQTLVPTGDGSYELDVTPDQQWLADPSTVFPVTIDPTTNFAVTAHTYVDSNNPTTNYSTNNYVYAGMHVAQTLRAFASFNTSASNGKAVNSALVNFHIVAQANSARTTTLFDTGPISTSTTYNNQPTFGANRGTANGAGTGGWQAWNELALLKSWATAGVTTGTIGLEGTIENDTSYYKQYDSGQAGGSTSPYIAVNYDATTAGMPTALASSQLSTFTPKLSGTAVNSAGGNVTDYFYVASPGSSTPDLVNAQPVTVASGTAASYSLLTGVVRANTTYSWWMKACDASSLCSADTVHQSFTIDPLLGAGSNSHFSFTSFGLDDKSGLKVNNSTGNVLYQASDVTLPGLTGDVGVGRSFNSLMTASGAPISSGPGTGYGWQMDNADEGLQGQSDGSVIVFFGDGSDAQFLPGCTGFCTPKGLDADLAQQVGGTFTLTFHASQSVHSYNSNGQLTDVADRNGNKTHYNYANQGCGFPQVTDITGTRGDTTGRVLHVSYNTTIGGCPRTGLSQTDSASNTRSVGIGQVFSGVNYNREYTSTNANGGTYNYDYDSNGNLNKIVTPAGHETDIAYDSSHRATTVTQDPTGIDAVTTISYPAVGEVDVQDALSHTTKYYSDAFGQITSVLDANSHTQSAAWTSDHKMGSSSNSTSGTTTYTYGANPTNAFVGSASTGESLTKTSDPSGSNTQATYNASPTNIMYSMATSTDSIGSQTTYGYDGSGNQNSQSKSPDETYTDYNTASHGNYTSLPGTINFTTEPKNKGAGNSTPAHCTRPNSTVDNCTFYSYNTVGNLTGITPPNNSGSLGGQTFTYDGFGRLKTAVSGNGITTTYTYDNLDRTTATTYSSGASNVSYTFDGDGNLTQRVDGSGTTGFQYDNMNRQTGKKIGSATVTCPSSPSNSQLCYTFDKAGNLTSMSDGRGTTTYSYDPVNNLTSLTEGATGNIDKFAYDANNRRIDAWYAASGTATSGTDACGLTVLKPPTFVGHASTCYDAYGRLISIKGSRASSDTTVLENLAYSYNTGGAGTGTDNVQTRTDNLTSKTTTYSYPITAGATGAGGRLGSAVTSGGGPAYYYCYDADGNITVAATSSVTCSTATPTYSYNSANQMTGTGTATDADGNVTASPFSTPVLSTLAYNGADMTTSITPSGGSADTLGYTDSQGERISQSQPSPISYANGMGVQSQTIGGISTYYERDPSGALVSEVVGGAEYYYFTDNIGSVLALVDTTGTQVAAYSYDPYGGHATVGAASSPNTNIANANSYRYAGTYYDSATGLYKMGVRYYDPNLGRFTQLDPVGHLLDLKQGNRYGYVGDDPINGTDPSGAGWDDVLGIGSFSLGALAVVLDGPPITVTLLGGGSVILGFLPLGEALDHLFPPKEPIAGNYCDETGTYCYRVY